MRTTWIILTVAIAILIACEEQPKSFVDTAEFKARADSMERVVQEQRTAYANGEAVRKAAKDSVAREQQKIAFGSLLFGTDEVVAYKTQVEVAGETGFIDIGRCSYYFKMHFDGAHKLYRVELQGLSENANHIDGKVTECAKTLAGAIQEKYGTADVINGVPEFFDYEPGQMKVMYAWEVGTKHIQVGIMEASTGSEYSAQAWIWDTPMQEAVWSAARTSHDAAQKDASKKF